MGRGSVVLAPCPLEVLGARLRFWEMDPRDKPEDDRATTIATTS